MTKVTYIAADGKKTTIDAKDGDSLMQSAVANGIDGIVAECGGAMMCATCHVYVDQSFLGKLSDISESEEEMLDSVFSERREESRLSCQIKVGPQIEGIVLHMPEKQQ